MEAQAPAQDLDAEEEELDLNRDEEIINKWRYLRRNCHSAVGNSSCGEKAWWMVVYSVVVLRDQPSTEGKALAQLHRGDPIFCAQFTDNWLCVRPLKRPHPRIPDEPVDSWHSTMPRTCPQEAWLMWNGQEKGLGMLVMPIAHLDKLLQYRDTNIQLPREAIAWTLSEVDVFLGSVGFVRPGRESALMRCTKRLTRAVRGGAQGLEYRVDEAGRSGGVFAAAAVAKGSYVEVCPLLEVDLKLRMKSDMLQRITLRMNGDKERYGIVLGFGKVYSVSKTPNLHWSYRGDDEVVLWAAEEVHLGRELTVNFLLPPRGLEEASKPPSTWRAPSFHGSGKLVTAGYIVHGNSGIHGRGVFTTKDAVAGDLLESCPALVLDEAGAEAMFSYRWGLADDEQSDFFIPLGLGSLYNHSEKPNARGSLDVRRRVLEFYATEELYKGQEVLVSYGDTYFDEDYAGHRKSELLHIESPETNGNLELKKLVELQRALIQAFKGDEFKKELRERAGQRQKMAAVSGPVVSKQLLGKTKSIHSLIMETEQPILERFGYSRGMKGAWQMQEDLTRATAGLGPESEAVRNNAYLSMLIHIHDPPPVEYWEAVELQLIILGTEESEKPEIYRVEVPKKAPCGYVRFMISLRFPQTGAYHEERVRLVTGGRRTSFSARKDSDLLPPASDARGRRLLVSGVGDTWPAMQPLRWPDGTDMEELTGWQIIWRWLQDSDAQRRVNNFGTSSYKIAGTWDDFKCNDMIWDGECFVHYVTLSEQRWESFQILHQGRWETTLHPDVHDGSPWVQHKLMGPDNKGHGKNWTMGRHADDAGEPGTQYKVELRADPNGLPGSVHWVRFANAEKAAEAQVATRHQADWAEEESRQQETAQARKRIQDSDSFRQEWDMRQRGHRQDALVNEAHSSVHEEVPPRGLHTTLQFDFAALEEASEREQQQAKVAG